MCARHGEKRSSDCERKERYRDKKKEIRALHLEHGRPRRRSGERKEK